MLPKKKQRIQREIRMTEKAIPAVEKMLEKATINNDLKSIDYYSGILKALKEILTKKMNTLS